MIGPNSEAAAESARRRLHIAVPVAGDGGRRLYDLFGFPRVLGIIQQSGVVVLDAGGRARLVHRTTNPLASYPREAVVAALSG